MKPYRHLPIEECGEALETIPKALAFRLEPHPYLAEGAPYDGISPWQLRSGVLKALERAAGFLPPDYRFLLFDAYRPVKVQSFMVQQAFMALSGGRRPEAVPAAHRAALFEKTFRIWAEPSDDPKTPPPHSTGAAVDLTLATPLGVRVEMGSPIDENSERSLPDYFKALDPAAHHHRCILHEAMHRAGFRRHPEEWWHFSLGDQLWAFTLGKEEHRVPPAAHYGRFDRITAA